MTHSKDIHWPEAASEEMWEILHGQLISNDGDELLVNVPWQGRRRYSYIPYSQVRISEYPSMPVTNEWISPLATHVDRETVSELRSLLSGARKSELLVPLRTSVVDAGLGSRRLEYVHPNDPWHVYTLHGAGMVESVDQNTYKVIEIRDGYRYRDWLKDHGKPYQHSGGLSVTPEGKLNVLLDNTIAGAYEYDGMIWKVDMTHQAAGVLQQVAEVPTIVWHAKVKNKNLGMYVSRRPMTVPLPSLFYLAETQNMDVDILTSFQHGEVAHHFQEFGAHGSPHPGNLEMCIVTGLKPTYWTDFETVIFINSHEKDVYKDIFNTNIFLTPHEGVRLQDIMYFLRTAKPHTSDQKDVLPRWEDRISAFLFGYFGKERIYNWLATSTGGLYEHSAHPAKAISVFSEILFDYVLHEFEPVTEVVSKQFDDMVMRTVMRIWLAIERGQEIE